MKLYWLICLFGLFSLVSSAKEGFGKNRASDASDPTTTAKPHIMDTTECSAIKVPFNAKDWIFNLPTYAPTNLLTVERVTNPLSHYGNAQEHIKILNFLINESKKFFTESKNPYFKKYVIHYPIMVKKFYCSLVGGGRDLTNFSNIDPETFYTYLTSHDADWDWLTPANVKRHETWGLNEKETVIEVILKDSESRSVIAAAWDETFSTFADLLEKITIDIQSEDFSPSNRIWVVPTSILPASFLTKKISRENWVSKMSITNNDLIAIKNGSMTVADRIEKFIKSKKL